MAGRRRKKDFPTVEQLEREVKRENYKDNYKKTLRSTIFTLVTVSAFAILIAVLWLPVLEIYGHSMTPTLSNGNIVISLKGSSFKKGDVIAFYYNNKILVKRVIGGPGDWIDIKDNGDVYVNNEKLNEPYVSGKALGDCNIELPYQVPDERYFVMGDHRSVSVDSRNSSIGCVSDEQIVGRLLCRIWPLTQIRFIN